VKRIFSNADLEYDFFQETDGSFLISVLCGSIGLYDAKIRLNADEARDYQEEGSAFLDRFALSIRKEESKYQSRFVQ
jgi:hypothetical protein